MNTKPPKPLVRRVRKGDQIHPMMAELMPWTAVTSGGKTGRLFVSQKQALEWATWYARNRGA